MKVLVCGNDPETNAAAEAAVYDAGLMPVGPVGNALRALGLADQEHPAVALVDIGALDDGNGSWLAEKLAERGIQLICFSDRGVIERGFLLRGHGMLTKPVHPMALAWRLENLNRKASLPPRTAAAAVTGRRSLSASL